MINGRAYTQILHNRPRRPNLIYAYIHEPTSRDGLTPRSVVLYLAGLSWASADRGRRRRQEEGGYPRSGHSIHFRFNLHVPEVDAMFKVKKFETGS